jgi:hypothetical protein
VYRITKLKSGEGPKGRRERERQMGTDVNYFTVLKEKEGNEVWV